MIKIENVEVFNWEGAIRGCRNPLNSWAKSDSHKCEAQVNGDCLHVLEGTNPATECDNGKLGFCIGENDLALMRKLCHAGSDHRKFLRQILVSMDITAPLYWWKEFDTYKVGTVANSCSTMHTIHKKPFGLDDFSIERLTLKNYTRFANSTLNYLNEAREDYLASGDKIYWDDMIQLLPSSYNQLRTVTLNYEVLLKMYHARKSHKLVEWHTFCDYIETLPYFAEICLEGKDE